MLVQSALGLLFRDQYRDVEWIAATWLGNDWVTLVVALPLLVRRYRVTRRGSVRGLLLWLGTLGYAIYNSAYYLFGAALNAFFPLYVATVIVAAVALILALFGHRAFWDRSQVPRGHTGTAGWRLFRLRRRSRSLASGLGCGARTCSRAGRRRSSQRHSSSSPRSTRCSWFRRLPSAEFCLWRRNAWGYIVSAIAGVQGSLYLLVLTDQLSIAVARGLTAWPGEIPMWGGLAAMTTAATLLLLGNAEGRLEA